MSIESDFRAILAAHAGLTALIGTRIAQNAIPDSAGLPCVVYSVSRQPIMATDAVLGLRATVSVQCWDKTAIGADAVADQVEAAIAGAQSSHGAVVIERSTEFVPDMGFDGTLLSVDWWDV